MEKGIFSFYSYFKHGDGGCLHWPGVGMAVAWGLFAASCLYGIRERRLPRERRLRAGYVAWGVRPL